MLLFKEEQGVDYQGQLEHEFYNRMDPRLRAVNLEVADYIERKWAKDWVVTCVNRDKEGTAHKYGRATDTRSTHFNADQKKDIMEHLNATWGADLTPIGMRTEIGRKMFLRVVCHVGTAEHFHIAINSSHARGKFA